METVNSPKNDALWAKAKKRAEFKKHLFSYVTVNLFLVALWYFTLGNKNIEAYFWPKWVMLGWGIGLAFSYFEAYGNQNFISAEKEYEKLINKK